MTFYLLPPIGALLLSALCGFIFIPIILNYCKEKHLYDIPNRRKVHKNPIPRLGGISFLPSMLIAFFMAIYMMAQQSGSRLLQVNVWSIGFLTSLLMIYSLGVVDDIIGLRPRTKFIVQIIAACILPLCGLYINNLYGLFGIHDIPYWAGAPLTILLIVFIDNAMNLIDGIDGLSASLSVVALAGFFYCFTREGLYIYGTLIMGLIGVLIPFLYYNMFGDPAKNRKIFMGDSGSLTLGFILGFLFIKYSMNNPKVMPFSADRIILAYSLLIIPTFDVVRVVLHRLRNHKPIFRADKSHIHHKLMRAGLTQHQALAVIIMLALLMIAINMLIYSFIGITATLITDIVIYTVFHIALTRLIIKHMTSQIMEGQRK